MASVQTAPNLPQGLTQATLNEIHNVRPPTVSSSSTITSLKSAINQRILNHELTC